MLFTVELLTEQILRLYRSKSRTRGSHWNELRQGAQVREKAESRQG